MTLPLLSRFSRPSHRPLARGQLTLTDTLRFLLAFSDFEPTDTLPVLLVEDGVRLDVALVALGALRAFVHRWRRWGRWDPAEALDALALPAVPDRPEGPGAGGEASTRWS